MAKKNPTYTQTQHRKLKAEQNARGQKLMWRVTASHHRAEPTPPNAGDDLRCSGKCGFLFTNLTSVFQI